MLHSFGREDQLDRDALARLVRSLSRYLGEAAPTLPMPVEGIEPSGELTFVSSRTLGGPWLLDGLWRRLGFDELVRGCLRGRRCDPQVVERVLFALVANRACDPGSKLAATRWVEQVAYVPGLPSLHEDAAYRAMDLLLEVENELAEQVFWATATLLDLEVDLLSSTPPAPASSGTPLTRPVPRDERGQVLEDDDSNDDGGADGDGAQVAAGRRVGFGTYGHSKDFREDLPQVVIGMAVTRSGIPIRTWCWPGNTADTAVMAQVRADLKQ